jgi:hypothetical protein
MAASALSSVPARIHRRRRTGPGVAYVLAWLAGLLVSPPSPAADAPAQDVGRFFAAHHDTALLQSLLVHGIAGIALLAFAAALARRLQAAGRPARLLAAAGAAAALVSVVQAGLGIALAAAASDGQIARTDHLFDAINYADSVKLFLLGALVFTTAVALSRTHTASARLVHPSLALGAALPVGGLGFVAGADILIASLYALLPLLLVWVGVVTHVALRPDAAEPVPPGR